MHSFVTWCRRRTPLQVTVAALLSLAVLSFLPDFRDTIVPSHDARLVQTAFHILTAGLRFDGEVPQWMPYGRYGSNGFLVLLYVTPVAWATALVAKLLALSSSLAAFKTVILLELLIFLTGSIRLSLLLFRGLAPLAVVNLGAILSFSWLSSADANFHTFYLLPFILDSLLRFARDGRFCRLLLAGLFCIVSAIGNVPYYPPMMALLLCLFCAAYLWAAEFKIAPLRFSRLDVPLAAVVVVLAAAHSGGYAAAFRDFHFLTMGRDPATGKVSLLYFLGYNGVTALPNLAKAFLTGMHTHGDVTFYVGLAPLALAFLGLSRCRRSEFIAVAAVAIFLVLFSFGGVVARASYYFPGMSYYRHIGLVFGQVKYLILLMAGFGLEALLQGRDADPAPRRKPRADRFLLAAVGLLVIVELAGSVLRPGHAWYFLLLPSRLELFGSDLVLPLGRLALYGVLLGVARSRPPTERTRACVAALLAAFLIDVGSFKVLQVLRWPVLKGEELALARDTFALKPLPWRALRTSSDEEERNNPAFRFAVEHGVNACVYVHVYSMQGIDPRTPTFRLDGLNAGIDRLLTARGAPLPHFPKESDLPKDDRWLWDALGARKPKLRLCAESEVDLVPPERAAETVAAQPRDSGRIVIFGSPAGERSTKPPSSGSIATDSFGYNHLTVDTTLEGSEPGWLYYADAADGEWTATVDGRPTPISTANLGFKALPLPPGTHRVEFRYWNGWGCVCVYVLCGGSVLLLAAGALFLLKSQLPDFRSNHN